jgi:exosome complex component RRP46
MAIRFGGRRDNELRELIICFEGLNRVDGSARFGFGLFTGFIPTEVTSTGSTAAISSISGPMEVRLAAEHPSHATFEVIGAYSQ